jgi:thiol-disulfide isomerase/thioredoxin
MRRRAHRDATRQRLIIALELLLAIVILASIYGWRTRDLLPSDGATPAPVFTLADLSGRIWVADDLKGQPTILYFFAPWCRVCHASAHQLRWFESLLGDRAKLVMIALDYADIDDVQDFRDEHRIANPILLGRSTTGSDFNIPGYPTYYVLDSAGNITSKDFGVTTLPGLALRALLAR